MIRRAGKIRCALVRHPSPLIAPGTCYGRTDLAIDPAARPGVADIVGSLASFAGTRVLTSPAMRCRVTAEAVAHALGCVMRTDPRLLEYDFGAWEGVRWDDVSRAELDRWAAAPGSFAPPGGETGSALVERVRDFHGELEDGAVVIAHGGPLKILAALLLNQTVDLLAPAPALGSVQIIDTAR